MEHQGADNSAEETLRRFNEVYEQTAREEAGISRIDIHTYNILKNEGSFINQLPVIGELPGIQVGFHTKSRAALSVLGIHHHLRRGIDYTRLGDDLVATCLVASGGYPDDTINSWVIDYSGFGQQTSMDDTKPKDQKLVQGNEALSNSLKHKNSVRVIIGTDEEEPDGNGRLKKFTRYTYDGLYTVIRCWETDGAKGNKIYMFKLARNRGQPELSWHTVG